MSCCKPVPVSLLGALWDPVDQITQKHKRKYEFIPGYHFNKQISAKMMAYSVKNGVYGNKITAPEKDPCKAYKSEGDEH